MAPEMAMQVSSKQSSQWREMQKAKSYQHVGGNNVKQMIEARWTKPKPGADTRKVNVDASVFVGRSSFSIGMIMRDHNGSFCHARTICKAGEISVFEAEAQGVLEALKWIQELGYSNMEIECDSLLTVQSIRKNTTNLLEVGNVIDECRVVLQNRPDICVMFVKKQANKVAHCLARVPCEANCFFDFSSPPHSVLESMMYDGLFL